MLQNRNYTIQEFSDVYRISRSALYRMWERRSGPVTMRVGRRRLIPVDAAEAWAVKQSHDGGKPTDTK